MRLARGDRLGPYEVVGVLGAGGMGEVYRARDTRLGREVAVKVLPAERLADEVRKRRFVHEARAASALNHPHIVTIHEIDSANGIEFIVMEYVSGQTLDELVPKGGLPVPEALRLAIPIADALTAAHARGIIHRDVKPTNVVVSDQGVVKVLDFGLAKLVADDSEEAGQTLSTLTSPEPLSQPGAIAGTVSYMSPEQATGGKVDVRSDIFAFGVVVYEMVTGRRPFVGQSVSEVRIAIVRDQPRAPCELVPEIPEALGRLILRCLHKDPERRFQHMADVKVELVELEEDADSGRRAPVKTRRGRGFWLATTALLGVSALVGGLLLWRSRQPERPAAHLVALTATTGDETLPSFSPDGDQLTFVWNGEKRDNSDIYVTMVGSTESRRLTTNPARDTYPAWSPDRRQIAYLRESARDTFALYVTSPLGGTEHKLIEPIRGAPLAWTPDGRWLAQGAPLGIPPDSPLPRGIRLLSVQSGETRAITSPEAPAYHAEVALSPDGSHLAYASCPRSFSCHLEVVRLGPDFTPIEPARRLTRRVVWTFGLAFTRDGGSLVYGDQINGRLWRVGIQREDPPQEIEVAGFGALFPAVAHSRDRLAFRRSFAHQDIHRFERGLPSATVAASSFTEWNPDLAPDGRRLAFESNRAGRGSDVWLTASDGSGPSQLTRGPGLWQGSPRWSPDGLRIAFDSLGEDGQWDVWTISADGGVPVRLTSSATDESLPSWSRDGRFVYFASHRSGRGAIWRVPAAGGREELVSDAGAGRSQEGLDGRTLFVQQAMLVASPLLAVALPGGPARTIIGCVPRNGYQAGRAGVYHLDCGRDPKVARLQLLDPASGRERLLGSVEGPLGSGFTASSDGKTVLFSKVESAGSDLVLIENFR